MMTILHHWYAALLGYYWMQCELCGNWYGGHQAGKVGVVDGFTEDGWFLGHNVCDRKECQAMAIKQNEEFEQKHRLELLDMLKRYKWEIRAIIPVSEKNAAPD